MFLQTNNTAVFDISKKIETFCEQLGKSNLKLMIFSRVFDHFIRTIGTKMDAVDLSATTSPLLESPIVMVDESGDFVEGKDQEAEINEADIQKHNNGSSDILNALSASKEVTPMGYTWKCIINLVLPFVNGMMLGFGEIFAHELMFRWGWFGTKVYPPTRQIQRQRQVGRSVLI